MAELQISIIQLQRSRFARFQAYCSRVRLQLQILRHGQNIVYRRPAAVHRRCRRRQSRRKQLHPMFNAIILKTAHAYRAHCIMQHIFLMPGRAFPTGHNRRGAAITNCNIFRLIKVSRDNRCTFAAVRPGMAIINRTLRRALHCRRQQILVHRQRRPMIGHTQSVQLGQNRVSFRIILITADFEFINILNFFI